MPNLSEVRDVLAGYIDGDVDRLNEVRQLLAGVSPFAHPVDTVLWVPQERVYPNDWNPNVVSPPEMNLLRHSIAHDGYTQPVVTVADGKGGYQIVDGFHRYSVGVRDEEIRESLLGRLPIVALNSEVKDRMAATVRHNRARGRHTVEGMTELVYGMLEAGMSDAEVCSEIGMEPKELHRLKKITGFAAEFGDMTYSEAWLTEKQVRFRLDWEESTGERAARI